jgi:hypothetical protein
MAQGLSQMNQAVLAQVSSRGQADEPAVAKTPSYRVSLEEQDQVTQAVLSPDQKRKKDQLQCILLEMGILFHSVFIGMALSVSIGNDFIVLLIAIIFHRTL